MKQPVEVAAQRAPPRIQVIQETVMAADCSPKSWLKVPLTQEIDSIWVADHSRQFDPIWQDPPDVVVLDISAVTFMDSTGIGLVARFVRTCPDAADSVYLLEPNDLATRSLDAVGLLDFMTVIRSPHDYRSMYERLSTLDERVVQDSQPARRAG
jgi:anti-anti-sigma factor